MAAIKPFHKDDQYDFYLDCNYYDDQEGEWDFTCIFKAHSVQALQEFGDKDLGIISMDRDPFVINSLTEKYGVPSSTVILSLVTRHKEADARNRLKGIGLTMLCSLLKYLKHFHSITHVFLVATTTKNRLTSLIRLYNLFGFRSIDLTDPKNMLASVKDIRRGCIRQRPGKNVPILFVPVAGSPTQQRRFVKDTYLEFN